jgi:hypothetical protein
MVTTILKNKFTSSAFVFLIASTSLLLGCDPDHLNKCEWYLVPDQDRKGNVEEGFVPACARNYEVNKQDCRLQVKLEFAKKAYNRKFKYKDLKVDGPGIPRTVKSIKYCE